MPDSARYKETGEEVYAIDLYHKIKTDLACADRIKKTEYICLACNVSMEPAAILPDSIPVPYFRNKKNHKHELGCSIYGYEKLVNKRRVKPVSTLSGFPCGYPDRLCLTNSREVTNQVQSQAIEDKSTRTQTLPRQETNKIRNWEVKTIGPLVKQFVRLTHSRDRAIPLYIPGVSVTTYGEVFQKLRYRQGYQYNSTRIYFAKLQYTAKIDFNNSKIKIPLFEGNWQQGKWVEQYFLEIDINGWPESHKDVLKRQINACLSELNEKKKEDNIQPWIFFLGQQATDNSCQFSLLKNDYRLIFCLLDNALYAEKNSTVATPHRIFEEGSTVEKPTQVTLSSSQEKEDEQSINKPSIPLKPKNKDNQTPPNTEDFSDFKSEVISKSSFKKDQPLENNLTLMDSRAVHFIPSEVPATEVHSVSTDQSSKAVRESQDFSDTLQMPLEPSQYAYDSQSFPSQNERINQPSSQQPTNFRKLEFDDRDPKDNNLNRQSQSRRGSRNQQENWLKSIINIGFQQVKSWFRQIRQWLSNR